MMSEDQTTPDEIEVGAEDQPQDNDQAQADQQQEKPAADAADKDKGAKTALDAGESGEEEKDVAAPADWPDDWRDKMANGNEDFAKMLKRFRSPQGVAKALKDSQDKIRSGQIKQDKPDTEDEAALKEWRKSQGIPDDPTGYTVPDAVKEMVTDDDKPMLASFTEYAHSRDADQATVDLATEWYFQTQDELATKRDEADAAAAEEAINALREEHGRDYKPNMQLAKRFMETFGEDIGSGWTEARLPDGRRLGDIPEFVNQVVDHARSTFGDLAFATADGETAHNRRKEEIEKIRNTDFDRYEAEGLDKEYAQILEKEMARDKNKRG